MLTATKGDLTVLCRAFGPPNTLSVEGVAQVSYRDGREEGTSSQAEC